jgi:hypothetical protein
MLAAAKPNARFANSSDQKNSGNKINIINLETSTATASRFIIRSKRSDSLKVSDYDLSIDYSRQPDYGRKLKLLDNFNQTAKKITTQKPINAQMNLSAQPSKRDT